MLDLDRMGPKLRSLDGGQAAQLRSLRPDGPPLPCPLPARYPELWRWDARRITSALEKRNIAVAWEAAKPYVVVAGRLVVSRRAVDVFSSASEHRPHWLENPGSLKASQRAIRTTEQGTEQPPKLKATRRDIERYQTVAQPPKLATSQRDLHLAQNDVAQPPSLKASQRAIRTTEQGTEQPPVGIGQD